MVKKWKRQCSTQKKYVYDPMFAYALFAKLIGWKLFSVVPWELHP